MSGLVHILPLLPDIEHITPEELIPWTSFKVAPEVMDNYVGNRLLYPQAILTTQQQLEWDKALVQAAIHRAKDKFYNANTRRMLIPVEFMELSANSQDIFKLFIDVCQPHLISYILQKPSIILGTILTPVALKKSGLITLIIDQQTFTIKLGELVFLPISKSKVDLQFSSPSATLMGQQQFRVEVAGGPAGIIVDAREVKNG